MERLGGQTSLAVPARVVASADSRVEDAVREGRFRGDLFHRIGVLPIRIPPLRERPEDVAPLTKHFLRRAAAAAGREIPSLSADVVAALRDYAWPGNVRELKHVVERALAASDGGDVTLRHLSNEILDGPALRPDDVAGRRPTLDQVERRYIAATLQHARGNQTRAAQLLGISRKALWEKRKRYGLD